METLTEINCSNCGDYAVTMNEKTCISMRSGKICKGKISRKKIKVSDINESVKKENNRLHDRFVHVIPVAYFDSTEQWKEAKDMIFKENCDLI